MLASAFICPFFSFHLSPEAFGNMVVFTLLGLIATMVFIGWKHDWRLPLVVALLVAALVISHPTTLLFVCLVLVILPFYIVMQNRKTLTKSRLFLYISIPVIMCIVGIMALLYLPQYFDSVMLHNMRELLIVFLNTMKSPEVFLNFLSNYTVALTAPSLMQKIFFGLTVPITLVVLMVKHKTTFLAVMTLSGMLYLLLLVIFSGGFFLERAFIFLAIPIAFAIQTLDFKRLRKKFHFRRIQPKARAVFIIALVFALFLPTFYWRECSLMFTDEETEAMRYSWTVTGEGENIRLVEKAYPLFFLIGESNANSYYENQGNRYRAVIIYDKSEWADYNLRLDSPVDTFANSYASKSVIFCSDNIVVYYLK